MLIKRIIKNFLTSNIVYQDISSYRRVIMINSMMSLTAIILYLFAYTNFVVIKDYNVAVMDVIAGTASLGVLLLLRINHNVKLASFLSVIVLSIFIITFMVENKNENFGIIWSIFVPYIAFSFNGKRVGLYISIFFYAIMFYLAFTGIGIWNNGAWIFIDFLRFSVSAIVLCSIIYMSEAAHENADKELTHVRNNEQDILERLQTQAITDELTKLYNRRYFNEVAPKFLASARERHTYFGLLILDIDYFKNFNDYYGHQEGDVVLTRVAAMLEEFFHRDADYLFRIGGEEFAAIMHARDPKATKAWLEEINEKLLDLNIEHVETELAVKKLTISMGLSIVEVDEKTTLDDLYKKADEALYVAKKEGRNRLVCENSL